ncbi:hypothetical protein BDN72DRAFT_782300 [Pluteus cervinus]|uniref:Uncharacterized protein n=1 Tax=Pluteus cervinus TaxID=181527 RepID=A0ACD2ZXZ4_9AGAR|nr:hypothetical protein BDN72DRAFT_782300 [Pluteus cervinus]
MLAPSKETSNQAHLPIQVSDPATDVLAIMFRRRCIRKHNLGHLTSNTPPTHHDAMPTTNPQFIPPLITYADVHQIIPQTNTEALLLAAYCEKEAENKFLRDRNLTLQSGNLLNEIYCGRTKNELQQQDEKRKKKGGKAQLTGMPCLVTGDVFYEEVQNKARDARTAEREAEEKREAKAAFAEAKEAWKERDDERKDIKERAEVVYKAAVLRWEKAKASAKTRRVAFKTLKPKMGLVPKREDPPKLKDFTEGLNVLSTASVESGSSNDEDNAEIVDDSE